MVPLGFSVPGPSRVLPKMFSDRRYTLLNLDVPVECSWWTESKNGDEDGKYLGGSIAEKLPKFTLGKWRGKGIRR